MSLITQCPACATMFKVVPDQLRISEGWVRCGQCDEVFDANAHLVKDLGSEQAHEQDGDVPGPSIPDDPVESPMDRIASEVGSDADSIEAVAEVPEEGVSDPFLSKSPQELSAFAGREPDPDFQSSTPKSFVIPPFEDGGVETTGAFDSPRYRQAEMPLPQTSGKQGISFMKPMPAVKKPVRVIHAVLAGVLAVFLFLVFGAQVALQERDRIAALEPGAEPFLRAVCSMLSCKVLPLRQIESVVIDSSAFSKVRSDVYRLNCTLKNTASTAVAMPAVELTLTDSQDQPVIRRIFTSGELGSPSGVLMPGAEVGASLALSLKPPANAGKISGYRLLAFYP